ncbi:MAG: DNA-processing protein DprA [Verrucomicrobiia bacterium]
MDNREAYVALNMIDGVGPIRLRKLLDAFGDAVSILQAPESSLSKINGIGEELAASISNWHKTIDLDGELKRIEESGVKIVCLEDEDYPPLLKQIYDPPIVLYIKGDLQTRDKNCIAIVGSRLTTHYGIETARRLAYQLGYAGITIISGGARGIDTAAHQGALNGKGRTITVLGTGINIVFPPENKELFEKISANGAVISQFPFNKRGDKNSFAIRNRVIAGMSIGTIVVEANLTSGALITANFAAEYGRQVFAVPGRIDSPRSKGCHDLIKKGAKLCEGVEDILSEFEYLFPATNLTPKQQNVPMLPAVELSENEKSVFMAIDGEQEYTVDEIIIKTGLAPSAVAVALFSLEMKRLIQQLPGKLYVKNL